MTLGPVALVFDVFGTLVDWRSRVAAHLDDLRRRRGERPARRLRPPPLSVRARRKRRSPAPSFDLVAGDFIKLAEQLGAEEWLGDQVRQHELKEPQIPRHVDHGEH